jgi:hypothetical protein
VNSLSALPAPVKPYPREVWLATIGLGVTGHEFAEIENAASSARWQAAHAGATAGAVTEAGEWASLEAAAAVLARKPAPPEPEDLDLPDWPAPVRPAPRPRDFDPEVCEAQELAELGTFPGHDA